MHDLFLSVSGDVLIPVSRSSNFITCASIELASRAFDDMDELLLEGVVVRRLDDELRVGASWDNCKLVARAHAKACSLQLKFGTWVPFLHVCVNPCMLIESREKNKVMCSGNS